LEQKNACSKYPETGGLSYALQRSSMQHAHHIARLVLFVCRMRCKQQHAALLALQAALLTLLYVLQGSSMLLYLLRCLH
jgi:hypothetical protein